MDIQIGDIEVEEGACIPPGLTIPVEIRNTTGERICITGYNGVAKVRVLRPDVDMTISSVKSVDGLEDLPLDGLDQTRWIKFAWPGGVLRRVQEMGPGEDVQLLVICAFQVYDRKDNIKYHRLVHSIKTISLLALRELAGRVRQDN